MRKLSDVAPPSKTCLKTNYLEDRQAKRTQWDLNPRPRNKEVCHQPPSYNHGFSIKIVFIKEPTIAVEGVKHQWLMAHSRISLLIESILLQAALLGIIFKFFTSSLVDRLFFEGHSADEKKGKKPSNVRYSNP